jgi:ABC-type nitrate/sulfonate/bicarbonate transport system permease component
VGIEFLIGYGGLGALIPDLADRFEIPAMYGAIVFVIVVSACLQLVVRRIETWLRPV